MKKARREFLRLAVGASTLSVLSGIALAQKYPARPVRLVVGYAAGGAADTLGRIIGQALTERLGQAFVVENRAGAGGNLATEMILRTPADGYTLLVNSTPNIASAPLANDFDFSRDTAPVGGICRGYLVMLAHPSVPTKNLAEFIAYAKENPGKITMSSAGNGTPPHMAGELFKMMADIDIVHVPYRGGGPAMADLLGGQVQVMFSNLPADEYVADRDARSRPTSGSQRCGAEASRETIEARAASSPRTARQSADVATTTVSMTTSRAAGPTSSNAIAISRRQAFARLACATSMQREKLFQHHSYGWPFAERSRQSIDCS